MTQIFRTWSWIVRYYSRLKFLRWRGNSRLNDIIQHQQDGRISNSHRLLRTNRPLTNVVYGAIPFWNMPVYKAYCRLPLCRNHGHFGTDTKTDFEVLFYTNVCIASFGSLTSWRHSIQTFAVSVYRTIYESVSCLWRSLSRNIDSSVFLLLISESWFRSWTNLDNRCSASKKRLACFASTFGTPNQFKLASVCHLNSKLRAWLLHLLQATLFHPFEIILMEV